MTYLHGKKRKPKRSDKGLDIDVEKLKEAYRQLEEEHAQIRDTYIEMIMQLAVAAEFRDADTGGHILRISDYAVEMGRALGLPEDEVEILRYASIMHDMGKIGIPDNILKKEGKLTPEEREVMKKHTLIGSQMFRGAKSPLLMAAREVALSHHERYDGAGYPRGLKGDEIPLYGRIVALVDIFDAVASKRCYKPAATFEEAVDYIKSLRGTHLDPKIVDVFVRIKEKVRVIYEANETIQHFVHDFENL